MRNKILLIICLIGMTFLTRTIWADTIFTKDGIRLEGQIQEDKDKYVKIKTTDRGPWNLSRFYSTGYECANQFYLAPKTGVICIPKADILRIEKSSDTTRKKAREAHNTGLAALKKEDIEAAINNFRSAIKSDSKLADAYIELGDILRFYKKDVKGSMELFTKALELEPDNFLAHFGMAYCYHDLNAYKDDEAAGESALTEYKKALALNQRYAHVEEKFSALLLAKEGLNAITYHTANANFLLGKLDAAKKDYDKMLTEEPEHSGAHKYLGIILYTKHNIEEAVQHLEETVKLGNTDPLTFAYLGHAYFHSKPPRFQEATEQYNKALETTSDIPLCTMDKILVLDGLVMVHAMSKEYDEAEKRANEIMEIKPDYVNNHYNLACINAEKGKKKEACTCLETAFKWAMEEQTLKKTIASAEKDSSFETLKDFPDFTKLIETYKKKN